MRDKYKPWVMTREGRTCLACKRSDRWIKEDLCECGEEALIFKNETEIP